MSREIPPWLARLDARAGRLRAFHRKLVAEGRGDSYEAAHAKLAMDAVRVIHVRREMLAAGKLPRLSEASQAAADQSYRKTARKLIDGLEAEIKSHGLPEILSQSK